MPETIDFVEEQTQPEGIDFEEEISFEPEVVRSAVPGSLSPDDLRPAVRMIGGEVVEGYKGETHPDIITAEKLPAVDIDQRGFTGPSGEFIDREAAAQGTQLPTLMEPGRLHSTDLSQALSPEVQGQLQREFTSALIARDPAQIALKSQEEWYRSRGLQPPKTPEQVLGEKVQKAMMTKEEMQALGLPGWLAPVERGVAQTAGGLAQPENIAWIAAGGLPKVGQVVGGAFLGQMATEAGAEIVGGAKDIIEGKTEEGIQRVAAGATQAGVVGAPLAVRGRAAIPEVVGPRATGEILKTPVGAVPKPVTETVTKPTLTPAVRADVNPDLVSVGPSHGDARLKLKDEFTETSFDEDRNAGFIYTDEKGQQTWLNRKQALEEYKKITGKTDKDVLDPKFGLMSEDVKKVPGLMQPDLKVSVKAKSEPTVERKVSADPTEHFDYSPEDLKLYLELKPKTIPKSVAEMQSPEFMENWRKFEELRNKYNGNPPKQLLKPTPAAAPIAEPALAGMGAAVPAEFARPEQAKVFRSFSGWTGKVKEALQQLKAYITPPEAGALPEVEIQRNAVLPRLPKYEVEKQIASSPQGMARVPGLGALVDPRAVAHAPEDAVFLARANSVAKGKTFAALWAQTQWRNRELFPVNKQTGTFKLANGKEGYLSDVIEAELRDPGSQPINHAQWQWIHEEWKPILDEINRMMHNEGIIRISTEDMDFELGKDYFPRPAIGKRNRPATGAGGKPGGRPGAKQFFQKGRKYATEEEGARPGTPEAPKEEIIYDPDPISRVSKFISGAYRAIADHRMANDPALGAGTVPEHWGVGRRTMAGPSFAGKIYPEEIAGKIEKQFAQDVRGWVRTTANVTSAAKALIATADLSGPFIQGAAMFARNPIRWSRSTWNSYKALLDPNVVARIMEHPKYKDLAEGFSQSGGSLLQLQDFLVGLRPGQLATEVPGYGRILVATGRAYGAFLDLAKLELFDAWSKSTPKSEWPRLAEAIENSLFMGRMEQIGMNPHRTLGERLPIFAPSYYRGAGGLISSAFQRGVGGKIARQMIGSYAAASVLIPLSAYLAMGMDEDEILERLTPVKGKFLKIPIELGDGQRIEVGFGNILTQLVRLVGQAAQYHTTDKPIDTGVEANPYLRFLRGRAAFIPSLAIELATGRDYFGQRISATESVARHFSPFVFQAMFPRDKAAFEQRAADAAFTFFGLNSYPEGDYERNLKLMNDMAQRIGRKPFSQLTIPQRATVVAQFKRSPGYKEREISPTDMERIIHINAGRQMALQKAIGDAASEKLAKAGLKVPGYKSTIRVKGVDVPMTERERQRYEQLLATFYKASIARMNDAAMARLPLSEREARWSKTAEQIGQSARARLVQEINSKQIK